MIGACSIGIVNFAEPQQRGLSLTNEIGQLSIGGEYIGAKIPQRNLHAPGTISWDWKCSAYALSAAVPQHFQEVKAEAPSAVHPVGGVHLNTAASCVSSPVKRVQRVL